MVVDAGLMTFGERRVLRAFRDHDRIDEVAHRLCLTRDTVKKHLQHIYAKLKVRSLHLALLRATELGLLHDEPTPSACDYPKG